ncbi:MAG: OPT/YSL family transporter, partial [Acidobacteria bacterium]|nr:OPT/YSL family transporter [Acidobacteriota bacterium]
AIGVYLPLASMMAIYLGGCARALVERGRASGGVDQSNPGVLAAAGLVAGEGLAGVLVAGLVATGAVGKSMPTLLPGVSGMTLSMLMLLAVGGLLFRAGRSKPA